MSPGPNAGVSYPEPGPGLSPAYQYEDADTEATELQCADTLPAPPPDRESCGGCPENLGTPCDFRCLGEVPETLRDPGRENRDDG